VHPNGRFVYLGNRSGVAAAVVPGSRTWAQEGVQWRRKQHRGVAIDQQSGEPTAVQHATSTPRIRARSGSTPARRLLVAGSLAPTAVREGGKVIDVPAGLSVFRMGRDGKLDFVRKYDIDVGPYTQWWTGMIPLA